MLYGVVFHKESDSDIIIVIMSVIHRDISTLKKVLRKVVPDGTTFRIGVNSRLASVYQNGNLEDGSCFYSRAF